MAEVAAKRGDLVVVERHHRDYVTGEGTREYATFEVGEVTSVTRDGQVRMWRRAGAFAGGTDYMGRPDRGETLRPGSFARVLVMPAAKVEVRAALAVAACHVWEGHEDSARPYSTLDEVRAALRPCAVFGACGPWAVLGVAAADWESARRAARPMLTAALDVAYADRARYRELSDAYHAAVTAANEAFRAAYAQACGELAAA